MAGAVHLPLPRRARIWRRWRSRRPEAPGIAFNGFGDLLGDQAVELGLEQVPSVCDARGSCRLVASAPKAMIPTPLAALSRSACRDHAMAVSCGPLLCLDSPGAAAHDHCGRRGRRPAEAAGMTDWNPAIVGIRRCAVGALGKTMPHRPEAEGAVRPKKLNGRRIPGCGRRARWQSGLNPHTKNGLPWSVGNHGSPPCDRWNRKALLVEDLLHQVGGGLGECELPKPGSMEAGWR